MSFIARMFEAKPVPGDQVCSEVCGMDDDADVAGDLMTETHSTQLTMQKRMTEVAIRHLKSDFETGVLDVNWQFQRQYVWNETDRQLLLRSLTKGIFSQSIVISEHDDGIRLVIDGKQRILSIMNYVHNEYPDHLGRYFSVEPTGKGTVLTQQQRAAFLNVPLSFCIYEGLDEEGELEVFRNLQRGKPLTSGEKWKATTSRVVQATRALYDAHPGIVTTRGGVTNREYAFAAALKMTAAILRNGRFIFDEKALTGWLSAIGDKITEDQVKALADTFKTLERVKRKRPEVHDGMRVIEILVLGYFASRPEVRGMRASTLADMAQAVGNAYRSSKWSMRTTSREPVKFLKERWLEALGAKTEADLGVV
jgi:hypothetical protein